MSDTGAVLQNLQVTLEAAARWPDLAGNEESISSLEHRRLAALVIPVRRVSWSGVIQEARASPGHHLVGLRDQAYGAGPPRTTPGPGRTERRPERLDGAYQTGDPRSAASERRAYRIGDLCRAGSRECSVRWPVVGHVGRRDPRALVSEPRRRPVFGRAPQTRLRVWRLNGPETTMGQRPEACVGALPSEAARRQPRTRHLPDKGGGQPLAVARRGRPCARHVRAPVAQRQRHSRRVARGMARVALASQATHDPRT
jgi:hypothetical protein